MTTSVPYLNVRKVGSAVVLEFARTDLTDGALIQNLGDEIYQVIKPISNPSVIVDLGQVERLSSATLGMLVALRKVIDNMDGQMRVANVAADLRAIFKMTRLDVTLHLHESIDAAVESLG
ncbi:MAG: STAS domain-containing protein [Planctomycetes bacterium]|nr:STAS domain-containing protein [Planctomycetota bacterium]